MNRDSRDELILRHLDGDSSTEETAQVTRLLGEDSDFRARFFVYVNQVARLREMLGTPNGETPMNVAIQAAPPPVVRAAPAAQDEAIRIDFRQIYFNAVLGGMGGLLGWAFVALFSGLLPLEALNVYLRDMVIGPLIGVCIGAAIGATDGLVANRSWRRMFQGSGYGIALGALGGLVGLPLGELLFRWAGGGVWPRALGWAAFGLFVGTTDGFARKMPAKIRYGLLGGLLGGLVGGGTYEGIGSVLGRVDRNLALGWGSAIGLIILGASIGALVGVVESLLRKAWLWFATGRLEGQTRTLDSGRPHTLGSAHTCTIILPDDPSIAPVHAEIAFHEGEFVVRPLEGPVQIKRDGKDEPVKAHVLKPGDRLKIGDTRIVFRNEEGKKVGPKRL